MTKPAPISPATDERARAATASPDGAAEATFDPTKKFCNREKQTAKPKHSPLPAAASQPTDAAIDYLLTQIGSRHEAYAGAKRDAVREFVARLGAEVRGETGAGDDAAFVERMERDRALVACEVGGAQVEYFDSEFDRLIALARRGARVPVATDISCVGAKPMSFMYRNHRGEVAQRTVTPLSFRYGSTQWHPEPQWLLRGLDHEKAAEREFAMKDIGARAPVAGGEPARWEWRAGPQHAALAGAGWTTARSEARARELANKFSGEVRPLYAHPSAPPVPTAERGEPVVYCLRCGGAGESVEGVCAVCQGLGVDADWLSQIGKDVPAIELPHGHQAPSAASATPVPASDDGDPRTQDLTWFWQVVDAEGIAGLPSVETDALRIMCGRLKAADAAQLRERATVSVSASKAPVGGVTEAEVKRTERFQNAFNREENHLLQAVDKGYHRVKDELRAAFDRLRWEAAIFVVRPRDRGAVEAAVAEEREAWNEAVMPAMEVLQNVAGEVATLYTHKMAKEARTALGAIRMNVRSRASTPAAGDDRLTPDVDADGRCRLCGFPPDQCGSAECPARDDADAPTSFK